MKLIIVINDDGEIWYYTSEDVSDDAVMVYPRIKKDEGESKGGDEVTH